ncbi:RNA-directed DNA polymerase, eukaryota, reverse transcriptase zinc-binding domain protein [Tanacetum coccineum]|uniref:RNA-directed DNA polymerase, eukaryota, reverse transcriptase zinc-binding domain protein n=1 Tax=Tanacetum coccineum TaxID=301880 RepID=A0ABQ5HMA5_9ASTR
MGGNVGHVQKGSSNRKLGNASVCSVKNLGQNVDSGPGLVLKSPLSSKYNDNVLPKVLIKGSGSSKAVDSLADNVHVSNSFQALDDHDMVDKEDNVLNYVDEEYYKVIWPKLQNEVVDVMKSGVYPSVSVRSNWSLSQLDFFYNNCPKYGTEPYVDDEVESDNEGLNTDLNQKQVLGNWEWFSNASSCDSGTGIVVGWDPNAVKFMLHDQTSQVMNVFVEAVSGNQKFFCSFVYAHYNDVGRRSLWRDFSIHSVAVKDAPWVLLGDFNVILDPSERSFVSFSITSGMEEFRKCISRIEVNDLIMCGLQYTWNKSPKSTNGLLKKLDRVMCNMGFLDKFLNSNAVFLSFVCSDHAPSVLNIPSIYGPKPKPFKFANFLATKADFCHLKLKYSQGDLAENVKSLNGKLCKVKEEMVKDPFNSVLRAEEIDILKAYTSAVKDEELFLKQRSKISWYFEKVLGSRDVVDPIIDPALLFSNKLSLEESEFMVRPVSKDEINIALFSMDDDKADGFSSKFFKSAWSIVGDEFSQAIMDFFANGKLLKEINSTISDNILLSQELMRNYHRKNGPPKVAFKIDIHKAYDNVDWVFLDSVCKVKLTHLCFADDLMIFSHGDRDYVAIIKSAMEDFSRFSSLKPSLEKSWVFFGNVSVQAQNAILEVLPFFVDVLPIKYLGVPLLSLRLCKQHCAPLIDKVRLRLSNWKNKSLSFAGRLQLINSVAHGNSSKGKAKVKWKDVCRLKVQGGLGIKLNDNGISVRSFWDIHVANNVCWSWRQILTCRDSIRSHVVIRIGHGKNTSVWWLEVWRKTFMFLFHLPPPLIFHDKQDKVLWKNRNELIGPFSGKIAWADLLIPNPAVSWYKIIWFSQNILRHAFMLWLAINKRLNTQDRVAVWNKVDELKCPLCSVVKDDHNHLFFGCDFSFRVWRFFKGLMRFESVPDNLYAALDYMVILVKVHMIRDEWCFCLVMGIGDVSDDLFYSLHDMVICKMQLEGEYYNVIRKAC